MSDRNIAIGTVLEEYYDCEDTEKVCALNAHYELIEGQPGGHRKWRVVANPPDPEPTPEERVQQLIDQYDHAIEDHLTAERMARGYTVREPSAYVDNPVPRYNQDAKDWAAHIGVVMCFGLNALNTYKQTDVIPDFEEFKASLPKIVWTIDPNNENPSEGMTIGG